jgi:hypothetical protein
MDRYIVYGKINFLAKCQCSFCPGHPDQAMLYSQGPAESAEMAANECLESARKSYRDSFAHWDTLPDVGLKVEAKEYD